MNRFLLDTHVFLWYISGDRRLPKSVQSTIQNIDNKIYLSVISLWEGIIKYRLGKLSLPQPAENYLPAQRERHQIYSLSLDEASVIQLANLPPIHSDPFDRMLICQAIQHSMTIVTVDNMIREYSVPILYCH